MYRDWLISLAENWNELPESIRNKINNELKENNRLITLEAHGRCRSCSSSEVYQRGVEVICDDCGYTREDYSADVDLD